jgi:cell division septation protein DedD
MAFGAKKGGGDMVLESRHVIGVFLLIAVISGIVFTLGYVLGRSQYDAQAHASSKDAVQPAASNPAAPKTEAEPAKTQPTESAPGPSDWDFYRAAGANKPSVAQKTDKTVAAASKPITQAKPTTPKPTATKGNSLLNSPLIPRGAITLQVAALTKEDDALALAEALQQKKFPAFVLTPGSDHYYRVQVGPYRDMPSANTAKRALENEGFKSIVKR